jgi:hypothetical protein
VNDELNEDGRVTVKEGGKEVQAQWFVLGVHNMEFIVYAQVLFVGDEDNCFP